jgi:hypothetical protein
MIVLSHLKSQNCSTIQPQVKKAGLSHSQTSEQRWPKDGSVRKTNMPIHKAKGPRGGKGWQYGTHGKVYPTREAAVRQAQAIKASQAAAKAKNKR